MTWKARFCSARRNDGQPCGNRSSDGRGGYCWVHRRQTERLAAEARAAKERRQIEDHTRSLTGLPLCCQTCSGPIRETVGMVCQACGTDYGITRNLRAVPEKKQEMSDEDSSHEHVFRCQDCGEIRA